MKQKKFPVLPVLLIGAIGVAAALNASKPMVGDYATVQKHIADKKREENAKAPETSGPRQTVSSNDLAKGMKDALGKEETTQRGNMNRMPERKGALITTSVPKTQRDATVNPAVPASGWFRDDYRGEKTNN